MKFVKKHRHPICTTILVGFMCLTTYFLSIQDPKALNQVCQVIQSNTTPFVEWLVAFGF